MATHLQSGPAIEVEAVITEELTKKKIGIAVASWNKEITSVLLEGAQQTLEKAGITDINIKWVPGSFELPLGATYLIEYANMDAVICIGCLIKGETPHFHYISEAVSLSLINLNTRYVKPVVFGVLTVDTLEQAQDRAGGKLGNKGTEAAEAALHMLAMAESIRKESAAGIKIGFGKK
jgi:6,7-dimethyl-8-ribityllumazine synthase